VADRGGELTDLLRPAVGHFLGALHGLLPGVAGTGPVG
jgi:hypothetical protein